MKKVLAIDPGERVGYAVGVIDDDNQLTIESHGIAALRPFAERLLAVAGDYDVIIYEIYRIDPKPSKLRSHIGSEVPTLQLVGMVRLCGWAVGNTPVRQTLSQRDTGFKVAKAHIPQIQEIIDRLPKSHDDAHDGDALAHLAYYYFKEHM